MTSADRNDPMTAQEKLEWVTPQISLMGAGDTEGKFFNNVETLMVYPANFGPS